MRVMQAPQVLGSGVADPPEQAFTCNGASGGGGPDPRWDLACSGEHHMQYQCVSVEWTSGAGWRIRALGLGEA